MYSYFHSFGPNKVSFAQLICISVEGNAILGKL